MVLKYVCAAIAILVSYLVYSIVTLTDIGKTVSLKNSDKCEKLPIDMPTEDLAIFGNFLIGATFDAIPAFHFHLGAAHCKPGSLISINPSTKSVKPIPTHGFPAEFQLNAHGIKLHNNKTLYVISHGYAKGGERIHLFDLSVVDGDVHATFKESFYFEGDHGMYNGLALVDENHFYLTQWIPFPDTEAGRDNSKVVSLYRILTLLFRSVCPIKFCTVVGKGLVKCEDKAFGKMPNGVQYEDKRLYVADSCEKSIRVYRVLENFDLEIIEKVSVSHSVDNIWLEDGKVYVAGINRIWDFVQYGEGIRAGKGHLNVPGGASKVFFDNGRWNAEVLLMQESLSLPASAIPFNGKLILSSIDEPSILICSDLASLAPTP